MEEPAIAAKIELDIDKCLGCESCVEICPSVFGFDKNTDKAYLIDGYDSDDYCIDEAIASCPAECIYPGRVIDLPPLNLVRFNEGYHNFKCTSNILKK